VPKDERAPDRARRSVCGRSDVLTGGPCKYGRTGARASQREVSPGEGGRSRRIREGGEFERRTRSQAPRNCVALSSLSTGRAPRFDGVGADTDARVESGMASPDERMPQTAPATARSVVSSRNERPILCIQVAPAPSRGSRSGSSPTHEGRVLREQAYARRSIRRSRPVEMTCRTVRGSRRSVDDPARGLSLPPCYSPSATTILLLLLLFKWGRPSPSLRFGFRS
jgi:hypothetical protein